MRVTLTAAAAADLADALNWYDTQAPGIGRHFLREFKILADRLALNPRQFPILRGEIHRAGFRRFPYGLFFRLRDDEIQVFACFHASRDPVNWQRRV
jgi:plasmid stabilization system protein ParE